MGKERVREKKFNFEPNISTFAEVSLHILCIESELAAGSFSAAVVFIIIMVIFLAPSWFEVWGISLAGCNHDFATLRCAAKKILESWGKVLLQLLKVGFQISIIPCRMNVTYSSISWNELLRGSIDYMLWVSDI